MLKNIIAALLSLIILMNVAEATENEKPRVTIMSLGRQNSFDTGNDNIGSMAADHLLEFLLATDRFFIVDLELAEEKLSEEDIPTSGIITPSDARKIAAMLNIDYLIYGNVSSVDKEDLTFEIKGTGGNFRSIKAAMTIRVMDVQTGEILVVAKGEGKSKSSEIRGGKKDLAYVKVGSSDVPLICVYNAMQKAAEDVSKKIIADFFNESITKK